VSCAVIPARGVRTKLPPRASEVLPLDVLSLHHHDDILQLRFSSPRSRLAGYSVSAWLANGVLIDTGFPTVAREMARALDELRPTAVAITHWHEDHGGNVELIARRSLPITASATTLGILRALPPIGRYRKLVWGRPVPLRSRVEPGTLPGLELVPTPGHSSDHHVVWDPERRRVFAGDLFLGVKVRALHRAEDPRAHAISIRRIAALRPLLLLDAHRGPVVDPESVLLAKADWIEEIIHRVERLAVAGWSDRAIAREVLGPEGPVTYVTFGDLSHLNFVRAIRRDTAARPPGGR
jgi:endoribonuclease LACTB2